MEFVKAYLALQKYRFGERLSYQIEIDEECRKRKVPKLTLVTFVENACVHGIESKASPGWIFVRVYEQNELICMEIEDTGNGMEEGKRQELLENMRNADIEMLKKKGRVGIVNACLRLKMVSENKVKIDLDGGSMFNTPPVVPIYAAMLTLRWIKANGGVKEMDRRANLW